MAGYQRGPWASERHDDPFHQPPPPQHAASTHGLSPFDDRTYPAQSSDSLDTRYYNGSVTPLSRRTSDPMESSDTIPLTSTGKKSAHTTERFLGRDHSPSQLESQPDGGGRRSRASTANGNGGNKASKFLSRDFPWLTYTLTVIQVTVFIVELVKNAQLTGSPIEIHPQFNPMIGPSPYVLINMGARFVPCMRNEEGIQDVASPIKFFCPNATTADTNDAVCSLSELCGMGGVPNPHPNGNIHDVPAPNQWWRFITPIFMHGGIIHISANMLLQILLGRDMERVIGPVRFFVVYFASGIFGFVLGANFAGPGVVSTGASGCLFGIHALVVVDLAYTWKDRKSPVKDLMFLLVIVIISFVIGLLPAATDNFAHIGGFLMGLAMGICVLHSPSALRKYIGYSATEMDAKQIERERRRPAAEQSMIHGTKGSSALEVFRHPLEFFKGRKPLWWAWWLVRAAALVGVFVGFIVLINNFYMYRANCSWCKYLSCIPVNNWCDRGNFQTVQQTTPRRWLEEQLFAEL